MDKNKIVKACEESIQHWERMLEWVKKQDLCGNANRYVMKKILGESWYGNDCPLCIIFRETISNDCPLVVIKDGCHRRCGCSTSRNSSWGMIYWSNSWGEWIDNTEKYMLPALRKALEYAKELNKPKIFSLSEEIKDR